MMVDIDCLVPNINKNLASCCLIPAGEQPQNNSIGRMIQILKEEFNKKRKEVRRRKSY